MNAEFNKIIQRLKTNNKLCIEVKDYNTGDAILPVNDRIDGAMMIEKYGSIEKYFIDLQEEGTKKIQIQLHKKQGNACIRDGIAYDFQLGDEEGKKAIEQKENTQLTSNQFAGLNGAAAMGLGMPEMINLHVDRSMLGITRQELVQEKQKTQQLEKQNKELEEKVQKFEKRQDTKEFYSGLIKEFAPALTGIFTSMKAPGLGTPETQQNIPDGLKGKLIQVLQKSEQTTDDQLMAAFYVLKGYSQQNETFIKELQQLFITHNFIDNVQNNSN